MDSPCQRPGYMRNNQSHKADNTTHGNHDACHQRGCNDYDKSTAGKTSTHSALAKDPVIQNIAELTFCFSGLRKIKTFVKAEKIAETAVPERTSVVELKRPDEPASTNTIRAETIAPRNAPNRPKKQLFPVLYQR